MMEVCKEERLLCFCLLYMYLDHGNVVDDSSRVAEDFGAKKAVRND